MQTILQISVLYLYLQNHKPALMHLSQFLFPIWLTYILTCLRCSKMNVVTSKNSNAADNQVINCDSKSKGFCTVCRKHCLCKICSILNFLITVFIIYHLPHNFILKQLHYHIDFLMFQSLIMKTVRFHNPSHNT